MPPPEPQRATLTIPSGQTTSNEIALPRPAASRRWSGTLYAPATMPETVTVEVAPALAPTTFSTLQSRGVDVTLGAGKATPLVNFVATRLRLKSGSSVGAARVVQWEGVTFP